jgi:anti-sigma B factor antagonist
MVGAVETTTLDIQRRDRESVVILDLSGRLTTGGGDAIIKDTLRDVAEQGHKRVILNLGGLNFLDSSGLGSLVTGSKLLESRGGQMRIVNARGPVRNVFQITRLDRIFPDYGDEEDAIASFPRQ